MKRRPKRQLPEWADVFPNDVIYWFVCRLVNILINTLIKKAFLLLFKKLRSLLTRMNPKYIANTSFQSRMALTEFEAPHRCGIHEVCFCPTLRPIELQQRKSFRNFVIVEGVELHGGIMLPPENLPSGYMYVPHRTPKENALLF